MFYYFTKHLSLFSLHNFLLVAVVVVAAAACPPPPLPKEKTHNLNASFSSPLIGAAFTLLTRSPGDIVFPNPSGWFFGAHNISLLFRWSPPPYVWIVCNMS